MSYINNSNVALTTILTQAGKRLLAQGKFNPTKFQIGDTGVSYDLYVQSDPPSDTDGATI